MGIAEAEQRAASGDLDACDGHNSSSSGNGGGPFFSFTRSPHRLFARALSDAQETAFEQLRLHLKLVSEGEEELPTDFIRQLGNYSPKLKVVPGVSFALLQIWISGLLYPTIELK